MVSLSYLAYFFLFVTELGSWTLFWVNWRYNSAFVVDATSQYRRLEENCGLVPRPSLPSVLDSLQYSSTEGEDLVLCTSDVM